MHRFNSNSVFVGSCGGLTQVEKWGTLSNAIRSNKTVPYLEIKKIKNIISDNRAEFINVTLTRTLTSSSPSQTTYFFYRNLILSDCGQVFVFLDRKIKQNNYHWEACRLIALIQDLTWMLPVALPPEAQTVTRVIAFARARARFIPDQPVSQVFKHWTWNVLKINTKKIIHWTKPEMKSKTNVFWSEKLIQTNHNNSNNYCCWLITTQLDRVKLVIAAAAPLLLLTKIKVELWSREFD